MTDAPSTRFRLLRLLLTATLAAMTGGQSVVLAQTGELALRVVDKDTNLPIAVRIHLRDPQGKPVLPKDCVTNHDHFLIPGRYTLKLKPGMYQFEMERGPEYRVRTGYFELKRGDVDSQEVVMERFANLKEEGWWSGDLHIHRPPEEIQQWMLAEDLHVAPVITWWNEQNPWKDQEIPDPLLHRFDSNRLYHLMAGEDERGGGALLYFGLDKPLPVAGSQREFPSPVEFLKQAKRQGAHVDIEKPFWLDAPIWLASGLADSIGLAHNHMHRDGVLDNEAWGKSRDTKLYPAPEGNGRWTQQIYYHALNCGLRLPPSAGSAAGVLPNPVGYNRVYVQVAGELTWDAWWQGLREGRVFVTNGPLLRARVDGRYPGHVFQAPAGQTVSLQAQVNLATRDRIEYLEVVQNGKVVHEVRLDQYAKAGGKLPAVEFQNSGWMLIRAVANHPKTYRFASTGPFYVDIGGQPVRNAESAKFFLDWARQRAAEIRLPEDQRRDVMLYHEAAIRFWEKRLEQ